MKQAFRSTLITLLMVLSFQCCKPVHEVITHHEYITHVKDSIVTRDSVVLIPQETYTNIAWKYDTLHLETSLATATAWVDSLWLRGTMKNKQAASFHHETETIVRDSIVYEKIPEPYPVEVMVEKPLNGKLLVWAILSSIGCLALLWWTFRKPIMKLFGKI